MYKAQLLFLLIIFFSITTNAQQQRPDLIKRTLNRLLSAQNDSSRSGSFMLVPALGYAQETGVEYGIASTYDFYLKKTDPHIRTSNITMIGTFTTKDQKNVKLQSSIWAEDNEWHIVSELRYRDWPVNFYGMGNLTNLNDEDYIGQRLFRARVEIEKKIMPKFYVGGTTQFEYFAFDDKETNGIFETSTLFGKSGGRYLSLGLSFTWDDRNNINYTTKGMLFRNKISYAPDFWKKHNYTGTLLEMDARYFYSPIPQVTLAGQALYRGTYGGSIPFYMSRDLGGDMTMRGYYQGRYRDKNYLTAQAELRYRFISRLGASAFAGTGSTFSNAYSPRWIPSYGLGLRYFFSLEHSSSIRFDYAIGEKRTGEPRQKGFYLSLSEAF